MAGREPGTAPDSEGVGGCGRGEPDGGGVAGPRLRGDADPAHALAHDARPREARQPRQPGGRHDRQVRGALAEPERGHPVTEKSTGEFSSIDEAIDEIRAGRILIVVDDEDRESEGDLLMAADTATPEAVNFMAKHGRGLICVPMLGDRLRRPADAPDVVRAQPTPAGGSAGPPRGAMTRRDGAGRGPPSWWFLLFRAPGPTPILTPPPPRDFRAPRDPVAQ